MSERLYGRERAMARAQAWVSRASAGEGGLLLLTGEPGIGKSRLMEWVATRAAGEGAQLAWGRCWEAGGAPSYWPWIQIFRALALEPDPFAASLLPQGEEARFQAFDRAVRRLGEAAARRPLVLLLDDLHVADVPSLLLLTMVARALRGTSILVVGAYRDAEARLNPAVAGLLAKVAREGEVLALSRLLAEEVAAWLRDSDSGTGGDSGTSGTSGTSGPDPGQLHRLTEGNPLFLVEALRLGPGSRLLEGLAGVLDERLARLDPETRTALEAAAVLGREFAASEAASTAGLNEDQVHQAMREAVAASIVEPGAEPGRFRFSHVLLRDRLYAELRPSRRAALHWRVGTARAEPGAAVHHLLEGHQAGSAGRAAEVALAAGEAALGRLAFEEAAALAQRAAGLIAGEAPGRLLCQLQLVLGEAQLRLGEVATGRATAVAASELADRLGADDLLARAALVYGLELMSGLVDPRMVALLRQALARLPETDAALRARVLARLAASLSPPRQHDDGEEIVRHMRAAVAMARRLGDPATLLHVLQFAGASVGPLVPERERLGILQETITLAMALDQRMTLLGHLPGYITALLACGQRVEAEAALPGYAALLAELPGPLPALRLRAVQALLLTLDGDFAGADRLTAAIDPTAPRHGPLNMLRMWHRFAMAFLRGDPTVLTADGSLVAEYFEYLRPNDPFVAWAMVGLGRRDEAAAWLASAVVHPQDLQALLGGAETCLLLGDAAVAQRYYPLLLAQVDRMFWSLGPGAMLGPTARTLGDLAALLGRPQEAARHYDEAIAFCERMGAPGLAAVCRRARQRGLGPRPASAPVAAEAPRRLKLWREGELWAVEPAGAPSFRLRHGKGVGYLAYLVDQPGRAVHVLELVGTEHQPGDAGPVLDARAKAAYRRRLDDLRAELEEAEGFADAGRVARAEAEIQALAEQLAGAVGLGGRDRIAASDVERARINVQRRLKDAIDRVAAVDPALGRYLLAAVRTGTYCSYTPV